MENRRGRRAPRSERRDISGLMTGIDLHSDHGVSSPDLVSVIVPAYNATATVGKCLDGILASDWIEVEIVVVDDGSRDETPSIVARYPTVRLVTQSNQGSAAAKNRGARESRGAYLYFLDSDVVIRPETVRMFVETIRAYRVQMVLGRYSTTPINKTLAAHYKALFDYVYYVPRRLRNRVYLNGQIGGGDFIERQSFFALGGYDPRFTGASVEREEFYIRFYEAGLRSAANPLIRTAHHFPSLRGLLRNYRERIDGTIQLLRGRSAPFTYFSRIRMTVPPAIGLAAAGTSLAALAVPAAGLAAAFLWLAWGAASWDFISEAWKRKGPAMALLLLLLHLSVSVAILGMAVISYLRAEFRHIVTRG